MCRGDGGRSAVLEVDPTAFVVHDAHYSALPARGDGALDRAIDFDDPVAFRAAVDVGVGDLLLAQLCLDRLDDPFRNQEALVGLMLYLTFPVPGRRW